MSLIDVLDSAADPQEVRLNLRALLRQLVNEIWILVVPRTPTRRLAAVQVFFQSGARRDYLIFCQGAGNGRKSECRIESRPNIPASLDLRKRADARKLEAYLAAEDLDKLRNAMKELPLVKADA
jgi:hypothetical protein